MCTEQLAQWRGVRGWRADDYEAALEELAAASLVIIVAVNIPWADVPEAQRDELAVVSHADDAQLESVRL